MLYLFAVLVAFLFQVPSGWTQETPEKTILKLDGKTDVLAVEVPFDLYLDLGFYYKAELVSDMRTRDTPIKEVVVCVDAPRYPVWKVEEGLTTFMDLRQPVGRGNYSGGVRILVPSTPFTIRGGATVAFSRKEWSKEVRMDGEGAQIEDVGKDVTLEAGVYRTVSNVPLGRSPVLLMVSANRDPYGWFELLKGREPAMLLLDDEEKSRVRAIVLKIGEARIPRRIEVSFIQRTRMTEVLRRF